jgi:hypothetical protein
MQRTKVEEQLERARGDWGKLSVGRLRTGNERLPRTRDKHEKGNASHLRAKGAAAGERFPKLRQALRVVHTPEGVPPAIFQLRKFTAEKEQLYRVLQLERNPRSLDAPGAGSLKQVRVFANEFSML